jgi:hypothetical protein
MFKKLLNSIYCYSSFKLKFRKCYAVYRVMIHRRSHVLRSLCGQGSSVSVVSDYRLDDRGSIPEVAEVSSFSLCGHTGSGAHPTSCTVGTDVLSTGVKLPGRDTDHSATSIAEVKKEYELYRLSPQAPTWRVAGQLYFHAVCFPWRGTFTLCRIRISISDFWTELYLVSSAGLLNPPPPSWYSVFSRLQVIG